MPVCYSFLFKWKSSSRKYFRYCFLIINFVRLNNVNMLIEFDLFFCKFLFFVCSRSLNSFICFQLKVFNVSIKLILNY